MKFWKNWPYWLKGGFFGLLFFPLLTVALIVKDMLFLGYLNIHLSAPIWVQVVLGFMEKVFGLNLLNEGTMFGTQVTKLGNKILMMIELIGPIMLGSLVGWIYGKIKLKRIINS